MYTQNVSYRTISRLFDRDIKPNIVKRRTRLSVVTILLLLLSTTTQCISETTKSIPETTKNISEMKSSISQQFSATTPCYDTSSGEISTKGHFNYIVSIADVHGDADALLRSLWISQNYIATNTSGKEISFQDFKEVIAKETDRAQADSLHNPFFGCSDVLLVQLGDIADRGPDVIKSMRVLKAASRALQWNLVCLLGNHEMFLILGDDSYVNSNEDGYARFGQQRNSAFMAGGEVFKTDYEKFLLMVAVRGESAGSRTLFVHAGLHPHLLHLDAFKSVASANELTRNLIPIQPRHPAFIDDWSPLWTRILARPDSVDICDVFLPKALKHFDVDRIIVGHTPQPNFTAGTRCGGRIILSDVATSRWMRGEHSADLRAFAIVQTLSNDGADVAKIDELSWSSQGRSHGGLRTTSIYPEAPL